MVPELECVASSSLQWMRSASLRRGRSLRHARCTSYPGRLQTSQPAPPRSGPPAAASECWPGRLARGSVVN
eukprot:5602401-Pyramimonas_sp.AAC.1